LTCYSVQLRTRGEGLPLSWRRPKYAGGATVRPRDRTRVSHQGFVLNNNVGRLPRAFMPQLSELKARVQCFTSLVPSSPFNNQLPPGMMEW
jgi:hypothetical protein